MIRSKILSFLFMSLFMASSATALFAASLADRVPAVQVGDRWVISVAQYHLQGADSNLKAPTFFQFHATAAAQVDDRAAVVIAIRENGESYGTLFLDRETRQVLRWEKQTGQRTTFNYVATDGGDLLAPILAENSRAPFDLPNFAQESDKAAYQYVPALEGDWGFPLAVQQTQEQHGENIIVRLTQGNRRISQTWSSEHPWWKNAQQPGFFVAKLVSYEHNHFVSKRAKSAKTVERRVNRPVGRWAYPLSGNAQNPMAPAPQAHHKLESHNAESEHYVWSGYWWPSARDGEPTPETRTYADGGLLEKYDRYHEIVNGEPANPTSKQWELDNYSTGQAWFGHCNGYAAAAVLHNEPVRPITAEGVTFTIGDLKGLLSEAYYDIGVSAFVGDRYNYESDPEEDPTAYEVHRTFVTYLGQQKQPMVLDIDRRAEVWNFPMYRYEMTVTPDTANANRVNVVCEAFFASASVGANFTGRKSFKVVYRYWLTVDGDGNPTNGPSGWTKVSGQNDKQVNPDFIWIPEGNPPSGRRRSHNPGLDWNTISSLFNTRPAATAMFVGETYQESLPAGGEVWFRFNVTESAAYRLTTAGGEVTDTTLELFANPNDRRLAFNDDANDTYYSEIRQQLTPGTYFARVAGYDSSQAGTFSLTVACDGCNGTPDYPLLEQDAAPTTGSVSAEQREAWFMIEIREAGTYKVETFLGSLKDTVLSLHDNPNAPALIENDDKPAGGYASAITRRLEAGTYFVKVRAYNRDQPGDFTIQFGR
ncbi:hypothetical protein [Acanthopleuribacter pedis]|uniref:Peptidase C-terminal archaeal/bacterial domain-containing protein n=1 Tax=Acanthopleuribacter pedis TaxID=442870 RepID=A0A8J7U257_9BACT|nr:hypothetical protein [Acanthopleuribacter pedis]MBO1318918.1 hypothetical protein [Acanthopleuribacter pedis]